MSATQYSITFQNDSQASGTVILYQWNEGQMPPGAVALAWQANPAPPRMPVRFQWSEDYGFVWAPVGSLPPGLRFEPVQQVPANPQGPNNQITFTGSALTNPAAGPPGGLTIVQDPSVPMGQTSVGIGLSQAAVFASPARPGMRTSFGVTSRYRMAFGNYQRGEVLEPQSIVDYASIDFQGGLTSMDVTRNADGTWTVKPG